MYNSNQHICGQVPQLAMTNCPALILDYAWACVCFGVLAFTCLLVKNRYCIYDFKLICIFMTRAETSEQNHVKNLAAELVSHKTKQENRQQRL